MRLRWVVRFWLVRLRRRIVRLWLMRLRRIVRLWLMRFRWVVRFWLMRLRRIVRLRLRIPRLWFVRLGRRIVRLLRLAGIILPRLVRLRLLYTTAGIVWLGLVLMVGDLPARLGNRSRDSSRAQSQEGNSRQLHLCKWLAGLCCSEEKIVQRLSSPSKE
jgi:hypothetical protein